MATMDRLEAEEVPVAPPIRPAPPLPRAPRRPLFADLALGDRVRSYLNPRTMLVVDLDGRMVTAASRGPDGVAEITLPRHFFRKVG